MTTPAVVTASSSPKVSVILTSYNHAKYIREAIDSVLHQTFSNFELLIWDDCSTDESWEIIQSYSDPRIKSFQTQENTYCGYINESIEQALGEYIAIQHSDDVWELAKLEKQVAFLEAHPEIGAVFSDVHVIGENRNFLQEGAHPYCGMFSQLNRTNYEWLRHFFEKGNALCHPTILIRKECYEKAGYYNIQRGLAQLPDLDMWIRLCFQYDIHVFPEKLIKFRVRDHELNTSGNRPEARIRLALETHLLLQNYSHFCSFEKLLMIFPEAQQYDRGKDTSVPFSLAMLSLGKGNINNFFAINLLTKLISNPEEALKVKKLYDFDYRDLIKITGECDVFSIEEKNTLSARLEIANALLAEQKNYSFFTRTKLTSSAKKELLEGKDFFKRINSFLHRKKQLVTNALFKFYKKSQNKSQYRRWSQQYNIWKPFTRAELLQKLASNPPSLAPTISILLPVYNPPLHFLKEAIKSVQSQVWDHWELCIVDDGSTGSSTKDYLTALVAVDDRIKVLFRSKQEGISSTTNAALSLASGDFVAFLDHDDVLAPNALAEVVLTIRKTPEVGLIYTDEDKLDEKGYRCDPFFKPDWNPDLLRSLNYCSHFSIMRRSLVLEAGGLDSSVDGAQDWDLLLRITERLSPQQIKHIPKILYHWRISPGSTARSAKAKPHILQAGKLLLERHLKRTNQPFHDITTIHAGGHWRIGYSLPFPSPLVSILIPTRNGYEFLKQCVESILIHTDYPNYEILIADNDSNDATTLQYLAQKEDGKKIRVIKTPGPFNYSSINNKAVKKAKGEILILLNNDIEVVEGGWLKELISHAARPEIGAVGALLYYPNGRIQHAGVVLGIAGPMKIGGVAGHVGKYFSPRQQVAGNRLNVVQNFSAVTGACLAVRKKLYEEVGGLDEACLPVSFNDVDFCLKLLKAGYRNLWTPFAFLVHHESASRGLEDTPEKIKRSHQERAVMRQRWGALLDADPAYNPNLTLEHEDWSLAFPPR